MPSPIRLLACSIAFLLISLTTATAQAPVFRHDDSEQAAGRYHAWLQKNWKADGRSAQVHLKAGDAALASGSDPQAAARSYARAIVADGGSAKAWLGLARALLATPADKLQNTNIYATAANAGGAAYKAYQLASSAEDRARSLAVLAEALKRRSFWRPAIDALRTSLELADNTAVRTEYEALRAEYGFRIIDYRVDNESTAPRLCIQFSEPLATKDVVHARFVDR